MEETGGEVRDETEEWEDGGFQGLHLAAALPGYVEQPPLASLTQLQSRRGEGPPHSQNPSDSWNTQLRRHREAGELGE
ncbi:hypothetical protein E2C01_096930 [Portunus trituberculatus]|uniref:Uncharacterized protein n=1 Tax=Portunus trituberculatus TaxID=210409 RepID=A0A5B7K9S9_PORTR|nr:hypothetical protein [Portunus trituberculatus]